MFVFWGFFFSSCSCLRLVTYFIYSVFFLRISSNKQINEKYNEIIGSRARTSNGLNGKVNVTVEQRFNLAAAVGKQEAPTKPLVLSEPILLLEQSPGGAKPAALSREAEAADRQPRCGKKNTAAKSKKKQKKTLIIVQLK